MSSYVQVRLGCKHVKKIIASEIVFPWELEGRRPHMQFCFSFEVSMCLTEVGSDSECVSGLNDHKCY